MFIGARIGVAKKVRERKPQHRGDLLRVLYRSGWMYSHPFTKPIMQLLGYEHHYAKDLKTTKNRLSTIKQHLAKNKTKMELLEVGLQMAKEMVDK